MRATHLFESASTCIALNQHDDAVKLLRGYLSQYVRQTDLKVIPKRDSVVAIRNLFLALDRKDPQNFREAAKQELSQELYGKLREEVVLAGHRLRDLRDVLSEVGWKLAPDEPEEQESTKGKPG